MFPHEDWMTMDDASLAFLQARADHIPLLQHFGEEELRLLFGISSLQYFNEGDQIIGAGDEANLDLYVLLDGEVHTSIDGKDGKVVLNVLSPYSVFGEIMSLLPHMKRSASVRTNQQSQVLCISHEELIKLIEKKPRIGAIFYRNLAAILGEKLLKTNILLHHTIRWGW